MDVPGAALLNVIWRTEPNFIEAVSRKIKMGRQPRSGDSSLAIGPFDPDWDRRWYLHPRPFRSIVKDQLLQFPPDFPNQALDQLSTSQSGKMSAKASESLTLSSLRC